VYLYTLFFVRVYHHISELSNLTNSIVTIGTFDGVHLGHQKIIKRLVELKKSKVAKSFYLHLIRILAKYYFLSNQI
jgi:FAD synthase